MIAGGECQYCQTEDESYGERKDTPCYEVLYLTETSGGYSFETPQLDQQFHTLHDLVLSKVSMKASGKCLILKSPSSSVLDGILKDLS